MRPSLLVVGVAMVAAVAIALLTGSRASANGGPHGGYGLNTSGCAGCHRAHTAAGGGLLVQQSIYALCTSCHGSSGTANTDVIDGVLRGSQDRLNGGGFLQVRWPGDTAEDPFTATTSAHTVKGLGGGSGAGTAWGGTSTGAGISGILECTSCHNPHGSTNYRLLRDTHNADPDDASSAYYDARAWGDGATEKGLWWGWVKTPLTGTGTITAADRQVLPTGRAPGAPWNQDAPNYAASTWTYYTAGMRDWCATCHKSYLTVSGSGAHPSTDTNYYVFPGTQDANDGQGDRPRYRHATSVTYGAGAQAAMDPALPLRFAAPATNTITRDQFVCTTCHLAHGSGAASSSFAANIAPTNDSALLYYDNRGVCRACHQIGK